MQASSNRLPVIVERSENGPFTRESDFDMALARRISELVKHYGIKFDRNKVVPADDDLADRVYRAGLDLFVEMGVYNQTTERRILFSREEVEDAVAAAPGERAARDGPRRGADGASGGGGHCARGHPQRSDRHPVQRALPPADPRKLRGRAAGRLPGRRVGLHLHGPADRAGVAERDAGSPARRRGRAWRRCGRRAGRGCTSTTLRRR